MIHDLREKHESEYRISAEGFIKALMKDEMAVAAAGSRVGGVTPCAAFRV